jgi:hypothetical protein
LVLRNLALIAILIGSLPLLGFVAPCCAQQVGKASREGSSKAAGNRPSAAAKAKVQLAVTPEREAAVKTFVARNHPELTSLLDLLKANQPKEYERAIRELYRVSEKLATIQERDSELYDLELQAWQVQSRIQLLVARLKMADSEDVRRELKEALGEQLKARAGLLRHERERVAERLQRIDRDLDRLEGNPQDWIDKQFAALVKNTRAGKNRPRTFSGKKPAAAKPNSAARKENSAKSATIDQSIEANESSKP